MRNHVDFIGVDHQTALSGFYIIPLDKEHRAAFFRHGVSGSGGAGGSRTHKKLPPEDFKSPASANSATAPHKYCNRGVDNVK